MGAGALGHSGFGERGMNIETCAGCGKELFPGDAAIEVERSVFYCVDATEPNNGCALKVFIGHTFEVDLEAV